MATTPPSGWYADPIDAMQWRYWDGQQWTGQVAPRCTVVAALSSYLEALLYRYANGQQIPGIDAYWLPPRLPA